MIGPTNILFKHNSHKIINRQFGIKVENCHVSIKRHIYRLYVHVKLSTAALYRNAFFKSVECNITKTIILIYTQTYPRREPMGSFL